MCVTVGDVRMNITNTVCGNEGASLQRLRNAPRPSSIGVSLSLSLPGHACTDPITAPVLLASAEPCARVPHLLSARLCSASWSCALPGADEVRRSFLDGSLQVRQPLTNHWRSATRHVRHDNCCVCVKVFAECGVPELLGRASVGVHDHDHVTAHLWAATWS